MPRRRAKAAAEEELQAQLHVFGMNGALCEVAVTLPVAVYNLKRTIAGATGIPATEQQLLAGTRVLESQHKLGAECARDGRVELTLVRRSAKEFALERMASMGADVLERSKMRALEKQLKLPTNMPSESASLHR